MIDGLQPYPANKASGAQWLGEVPEHWDLQRLKSIVRNVVEQVADRQPGEAYIALEHIESGTGRIRESGSLATFDSQVKRFQAGDVLFGKLRPYLAKVARPARNGVCVGEFFVLRPVIHREHTAYVEHLLRSKPVIGVVNSSTFGAKMPRAEWQFVGNLRFPLPPSGEQAAIVRFLDHTDRAILRFIRGKKRLIALLNEQKQAIIDRVVTRGLDPTVRLKPSGVEWLGDVPEHWVVCRSRRLFSVRTELARPDDVQLSATQAYGVIPQSEFEMRVGRKVVRISMHLDKRRHVEKDDFVISMRSFQGGLERAWASGAIRSSYVVLRAEPSVDIGYFAYVFKSRAYIGALQSTADFIRDGQDLTFDNFCRVDLPSIPMDEQQAIARFIAETTTRIDVSTSNLSREIYLLGELRTRLIADVVTGKVDVREAATHLPKAPETSQDEGVPDEDAAESECADLDDAEAEVTA